ncbi:hypothetical protein Poli38472_009345 [Pythium oligandrum]|uniref:Uncharacterized protein n=1 Tax=Pythium oligandrum TaxID=41045 RepID=A0A8K1CLJ8_PYTOL|nr:hypothetical protein Poli38472_009345 [Pythium oligandrum]|eukprot:TMW65178.1 hypothetical protein Poli38472_009345 [Pythium oligandrum]
MRRLLRYLYSQGASYSTYCAEITEVMLESPLFKTLTSEGRVHTLAMMIKAATSMERVDTIRLLIAHGARVDDDTVMQLALKQADAAAVQVLAESGVSWLTYPHMKSDFCGHSTVARLLVRNGLDVQVKGDESSSVHIAALDQNVETLLVWLEEGYADVDVQCYGEKTPLTFAVTDCRYGNEEVRLQIIQTLPEYGADVRLRDFGGATVMFHALVLQDEAVVEMLIKAGADLCVRDEQNHSPYDRLMVTDSGQAFVNAHPQYFHPSSDRYQVESKIDATIPVMTL